MGCAARGPARQGRDHRMRRSQARSAQTSSSPPTPPSCSTARRFCRASVTLRESPRNLCSPTRSRRRPGSMRSRRCPATSFSRAPAIASGIPIAASSGWAAVLAPIAPLRMLSRIISLSNAWHWNWPTRASITSTPRSARCQRGDVIYYPQAFSTAAIGAIEERVAPAQRIALDHAEASQFSANAVSFDHCLVLSSCTGTLRARIEERGFTVLATPLHAFLKSGGSACCLTLRLDHRSEG